MDISIHFDLVQILGIAVLAWLAGNVGSIVGIIATSFFVPSLDGQKVWTALGMFSAMGALQIPKLIIAVIGAAVAIAYYPSTAVKAAAIICFLLGLLVMLLAGFLGRR